MQVMRLQRDRLEKQVFLVKTITSLFIENEAQKTTDTMPRLRFIHRIDFGSSCEIAKE